MAVGAAGKQRLTLVDHGAQTGRMAAWAVGVAIPADTPAPCILRRMFLSMHTITFSTEPGYDHHECDSVVEGEWVVFRCPICSNYERRINLLTGETKVKNLSSVIRHSGRHNPIRMGH